MPTNKVMPRGIDLDGESPPKPKKPLKRTTKAKSKSKGTVYDCETCGLYKTCLSPKMEVSGRGRRKVLIIAEAPGRTEDEEGIQLVGEAGSLLRIYLKNFGFDLDRDFWKTNSLSCRPPENKKPTKKQLKCCKSRIDKAIAEYKPNFIWLMGGSAVQSFYMDRFNEDLSISRWRGLCIPDSKTGAWVLPLFHPSYILRNENDDNLSGVFERDLKYAISCLDRGPPEFAPYVFKDYEPLVQRIYKFRDVQWLLEDLLAAADKGRMEIAFDYETTSLKPFGEEQKIWTIALAYDSALYTDPIAAAFPLDYPHWNAHERRQVARLWKKILLHPNIIKIGHNLKFEDMWSKVIFGLEQIPEWLWCTMNVAHILDNRKEFTGLKFQVYINFGIENYDASIKDYLKVPEGAKINTLNEAPLDDVLLYNGLDALFTLLLKRLQQKKLRRKDPRWQAIELFTEGLQTLSDTQISGIPINREYYEETNVQLSKKIDSVTKRILTGKTAQLFETMKGYPLSIKTKDISTKDLRALFFDVLGMTPRKFTETGLNSIDAETLEKMNHPVARRIIQRRRLMKIRDTYLSQFNREEVNGIVHPFIDLHTTATYRSSSSRPNVQNQPKRDEEAAAYVRKGIFPHPGQKLGDADFGSLEVRIIACFTRDKTLIEYIFDPTSDMHDDQAAEIFLLDEEQRDKKLRFYAKNCFVFPQFYGSSYIPCANNLWQNCISLKTGEGIPLRNHLRERGIRRFDDFVAHVQDVEADFWERFPGVRAWQEEMIADYQRTGYVQMFFGFRRTGYMNNNMIINSPIQGTAFHLLLWSMNRLHRIAKKEWKTKIIGEIHDSILLSIEPSEEAEVYRTLHKVMVQEPANEFDWLIVPMDIEIETGEVDKPWYEVNEVDLNSYLEAA